MKRFLVAFCVVVFLPLLTSAYTLVLKDGRRLEIREQYRIVKDIAVFTLADNTRFSLSLEKINIAETELANGLTAGLFLKNTSAPSKETDNTTKADDNPITASRATSHKITNSDFDKYRIRREETNKDATERAAAKVASNLAANPAANPNLTGAVVNPVNPAVSAQTAAQTAFDADLAQYREEQKNKEIYWRTRARTLLTQMRVEEEQLALLRGQLENTRQQPTSSVSVYTPPPVYPYPGVTIGRIPIGLGGPRSTGGAGNVIVVNNQNQNNLSASLQDKIIQLELQYQATLILYDEMREDARHDGALPGWLR